MKIGNTIKEKRLQKGMTQEELALRSDITVRTVQRIESGEVDPRSFTLQAIASALEVDYNELVSADEPPKSEEISSNETFWLAILHFSGIILLIIPTVIIWTLKKDKISNLRSHAIDSINFQLSMMLYLIFTAFLCLVPVTIALSPTVKIPIFLAVGIPIFTVVGIYIATIVIINASKAANNQPYRYLLCIKFLRK
jgi:transcriptional regulator with XRE-family HTH domain